MTIIVTNQNLSSVKHLNYADKTNQGSFYTPKHIVKLTYELLKKSGGNKDIDTILEPSCGYGAYIDFDQFGNKTRFIGADIDESALKVAKSIFPNVKFFNHNALCNISRDKYGIGNNESLVIVGNPPYNDTTSHVKNNIKKDFVYNVDKDIITRDLGLSSLLAYNKLNPEYIAVLHPLSYLIKKTNFNLLKPLMKRYLLKEALVFNSQEFSDTSKMTGFPIVIAVYERNSIGTTYDDIYNRVFRTIEGRSFSLAKFDYISNYISKYPGKIKKDNFEGYLFYTMRDINALKRCRTFICENIPNAIQVDRNKIDYYHYADVFKEFAKKHLPYYMGNLDIPIDNDLFLKNRNEFRTISEARHPEIFNKIINDEDILKAKIAVGNYFRNLFSELYLTKE